MKFIVLFLGILCSFSILPFTYADENEESIDYSDPVHVYEGRIKYSDPVFENMTPSHVCNCVTFRFDDIQNDWLPDVQFEMLKTFRDNNIPVTIGIIGNALEGEMADYIKNYPIP